MSPQGSSCPAIFELVQSRPHSAYAHYRLWTVLIVSVIQLKLLKCKDSITEENKRLKKRNNRNIIVDFKDLFNK